MNTISDLNAFGHTFLAVAGSFASNVVVHPLCTIKNRQMANEKVFLAGNLITRLRGLYQGYTEICLTEASAFTMTYMVNGFLKKNKIGPLSSAIIAGIASSPVIAVGEGLMVNRQVNGNGLTYRDLKSSIRFSGLFSTIIREVPFTVSLFALAPAIEKKINITNELFSNTVSGFISGSICGAITAPADKIKTLVQAKELSFINAAKSVAKEMGSVKGKRNMFIDASNRAVYLGLSLAIFNILNNQLPQFLPLQMKTETRQVTKE